MALLLVKGTGDPAFVARLDGTIVAWNEAAANILAIDSVSGGTSGITVGGLCFELLCGRDSFGNRFCDRNCALTNMARRAEPPRGFPLWLKTVDGTRVKYWMTSVIVPSRDTGDEASIFHLLHELNPADGVPRVAEEREEPPSIAPEAGPVPCLSGREMEVLNLLADGTSTQDIAHELFISVTTVRSHVQSILGKLGVHSKLEAVAAAYRTGLISS